MQVRVFYEKDTGRVARIEHRLDERYTDDNADNPEGHALLVTDGSGLENVPFSDLLVQRGRLKRNGGQHVPQLAAAVHGGGATGVAADLPGADPAAQARLREIAQVDKSALSDEEWLRLYREHASLTGRF